MRGSFTYKTSARKKEASGDTDFTDLCLLVPTLTCWLVKRKECQLAVQLMENGLLEDSFGCALKRSERVQVADNIDRFARKILGVYNYTLIDILGDPSTEVWDSIEAGFSKLPTEVWTSFVVFSPEFDTNVNSPYYIVEQASLVVIRRIESLLKEQFKQLVCHLPLYAFA